MAARRGRVADHLEPPGRERWRESPRDLRRSAPTSSPRETCRFRNAGLYGSKSCAPRRWCCLGSSLSGARGLGLRSGVASGSGSSSSPLRRAAVRARDATPDRDEHDRGRSRGRRARCGGVRGALPTASAGPWGGRCRVCGAGGGGSARWERSAGRAPEFRHRALPRGLRLRSRRCARRPSGPSVMPRPPARRSPPSEARSRVLAIPRLPTSSSARGRWGGPPGRRLNWRARTSAPCRVGRTDPPPHLSMWKVRSERVHVVRASIALPGLSAACSRACRRDPGLVMPLSDESRFFRPKRRGIRARRRVPTGCSPLDVR